MTTSAMTSALSAQPLDSLLITNDRSHKLIDNCHQIDFKSRFCLNNVSEMLSNNNSNNIRSDGKSESTKHSSDLMATQLKSSDLKINALSTENQSVLKSNSNKSDKIKDCIQQTVSEKTKKRITAIINEIEEFNDIEKLWLYIQLPNGSAQEVDPLKQKGPGNPFGKKADIEVAQTYTWIQSHLEEDASVSLPKQEVYEEYKVFCDANKFEPLCVADFGKAMKHVFPKVKPRRLGQRGNSKYCYSGLRKKINIEAPELPVLDTSNYDSKKSHINWDSDTNGVTSDESLAESDVITLWATKLLDRSFDSIPELAQYLIASNSVDITLSNRIGSKSSEDKQFLKSNSKSSNCSRRRDVQNQLQRKIQEKEALKEQKRRTDLSTKSIESLKLVQNCIPKGIRKTRKNSVSKLDEFETTASFGSHIAVPIKTEPELEISPSFSSNQLFSNNRIQNKVAIPRTVTPSRMSQSAISTSIILVPTATTVRLTSPQSTLTNESTSTTTTVSTLTNSPLKPNTSKYKRIQPKPVNICRSDSESAVCANNCSEVNETFNSIAKRRHSVSVPLSKESKLKPLESFGDKQSQPKRQIEERESFVLVSKKRHIDNVNTMVSNSTNSSGFDDANSSNSLSPISQELQNINTETVGSSDIRINELESEALMDYFNVNSIQMANKEQWDVSNQTAQLSQLRKLLENHLPNTVTKTGTQRIGENAAALEGYSELREALLRKNLNNTVQTYGTLKPLNTFTNEQNSINNTNSRKPSPKNRNLEALITSPDIEGLPSITDVSKIHSLSTNGDFFSNQSNEIKNGFQPSVNIQVPSVPPSPTARRRAFNFQPISPRNTPTIPENCSIDSIGFNGFSYSNNALSSSPQYRHNQQTIGVGPSQPSSEANSPFVSPRSTPVTPITPVTPLPLSRSRHNSGQSNYSALRQTPQQNFDSGVSSISNSPFISPQTTPLPISRVRTGTGGMQRNISRVRHSSGPGGPITLNGMTASFLCHRSNSLSPMIGDSFTNGTHGFTHCLPSNEFISSQISFPSIMNPMTAKSRTPNSPLSPIAVLHNSDINSLTTDAMNGSSEMAYNQQCEPLLQNDWPSNRMKTAINDGSVRQRHVSTPYNSPSTPATSNNSESFSREILSYLKNSENEKSENEIQTKFIMNRCQSVPVSTINSNMAFAAKLGNTHSEANSVDLENQLLDESTTISKSYPATPICSQPFQFPPSPPSSTKQQMAFNGDDIISGNVLQSGQDLMVSGVQLRDSNVWNTTISNTQHNDNDLMTINVNSIGPNSSNARRNLNDLLAEPPDDLQTTLEDLRDCDNDFSKFAQQLELEANDCTYDDLN